MSAAGNQDSQIQSSPRPAPNGRPAGDDPTAPAMLSPSAAWRVLCRATGTWIARATFYRWVTTGRVYSVRLGYRLYIPWPSLDDLIRQCKSGERF